MASLATSRRVRQANNRRNGRGGQTLHPLPGRHGFVREVRRHNGGLRENPFHRDGGFPHPSREVGARGTQERRGGGLTALASVPFHLHATNEVAVPLIGSATRASLYGELLALQLCQLSFSGDRSGVTRLLGASAEKKYECNCQEKHTALHVNPPLEGVIDRVSVTTLQTKRARVFA